jgi:hypothetical protein
MFNFYEYWVFNKKLNIKWKYLISNTDDNTITINKINLIDKLNDKIIVKFRIMNKNYLYFNFYSDNVLFYSISHRSFKENKWYPQWNCAFINKVFLDSYKIDKY